MATKIFSNRIKQHKLRAINSNKHQCKLITFIDEIIINKLNILLQQPKQSILFIGNQSSAIYKYLESDKNHTLKSYNPLIDDEFLSTELLPHAQKNLKFDVIIEHSILHWINDPLQYLVKIHNILNDKGLYISFFFGEKTLYELRDVMINTDLELFNSTATHISPMLKISTVAQLMQTAIFKNPVIEHQEISGLYKNCYELIANLRSMGENNTLKSQINRFAKNYIETIHKHYNQHYRQPVTNEIIATFDLVSAIGWK